MQFEEVVVGGNATPPVFSPVIGEDGRARARGLATPGGAPSPVTPGNDGVQGWGVDGGGDVHGLGVIGIGEEGRDGRMEDQRAERTWAPRGYYPGAF
jgi:hypothetical protein